MKSRFNVFVIFGSNLYVQQTRRQRKKAVISQQVSQDINSVALLPLTLTAAPGLFPAAISPTRTTASCVSTSAGTTRHDFCCGILRSFFFGGRCSCVSILLGQTWWPSCIFMALILSLSNTEIGRNPVSKHQIQLECGERAGLRGTGRLNSSRETKFPGAYGDRGICIFPV